MEGPPSGINLSETQVPRILGVNIATFALACTAIVLRFISRRLSRATLWWDDWLMIPAIVRDEILMQHFIINDCGVDFCRYHVLYLHHL